MRLVTARCTSGHRSGWEVPMDATGASYRKCQTCGEEVVVLLDRSEAVIRPRNTPLQQLEWATERSREAREILRDLVAAVEGYLPLRDITVEELPPQSPLQQAVFRARLELAKSAP